MSDFDYKDFGKDFVQTPVMKLKRRLFQIVPHARDLEKIVKRLIRQVPAETRNIRITIEYIEVQTRMLKPRQRQVQPVVPTAGTKTQQPTDPTRTILTWREFSDKVADRVDEAGLKGISTEILLDEEMTLMMNEILEIFEDYLWLMMQKGILFATEEMNRIDPKYHFTAGWQPSDDLLLANLLTGCRTYLTNWTGDIKTEAAKQIREGIGLGESADQIGKRVANTIQSQKWRGTLIARTELMRAWNSAAFDRYYKAGFGATGIIPPAHPNCRCGLRIMQTPTGYKIVWMTARDPIVCEVCQPLDGVPIDEINQQYIQTITE